MDWEFVATISTPIAALAACLAAWLVWWSIRRQTEDQRWAARYDTFKELEFNAGSRASLDAHGITGKDLDNHGLNDELLSYYCTLLNSLWAGHYMTRRSMTIRARWKWNRCKTYQDKVDLCVRENVILPVHSNTGRIIRTRQFREAWPLIQHNFWSMTPDAEVAPIVDATLHAWEKGIPDRYREVRKMEQHTDNGAEE